MLRKRTNTPSTSKVLKTLTVGALTKLPTAAAQVYTTLYFSDNATNKVAEYAISAFNVPGLAGTINPAVEQGACGGKQL